VHTGDATAVLVAGSEVYQLQVRVWGCALKHKVFQPAQQSPGAAWGGRGVLHSPRMQFPALHAYQVRAIHNLDLPTAAHAHPQKDTLSFCGCAAYCLVVQESQQQQQ
jgi:hypothetical protein